MLNTNTNTKPSSTHYTNSSSNHSLCSIADSVIPPVKFRALRVSQHHLSTIHNKKLKSFYTHQNHLIDLYEEVDRIVDALQEGQNLKTYGTISSQQLTHMERDIENQSEELDSISTHVPLLADTSSTESASSPPWLIRLAINMSFTINIGLFLAKLALALFSGSMAILATAFESFLDILSNAIIFCTTQFIRKKDYYAYPVGKSRIEPLGIIVFSVVITTSFGQVLLTSIKQLTGPIDSDQQIHLDALGLGILAGNIGIKAALWLWCASIKGSSSVQVLGQDHRNDVLFNSASAIFPIVAVWAKSPWVDPAGAILLSLYIIYEWSTLLLGK
ncbi:hypothetical protein BC941DRAFT_461767 [Chlamydoabsidia padenii]|nr:hypothetical protein BC941DRAFT_461767 [Chlamydoabsidia padenii]